MVGHGNGSSSRKIKSKSHRKNNANKRHNTAAIKRVKGRTTGQYKRHLTLDRHGTYPMPIPLVASI